MLISLSSAMVVAADEVESSRRTEGRLLFGAGLLEDFNWKSTRLLETLSLNWFVESLPPESESSCPHRTFLLTAWTFVVEIFYQSRSQRKFQQQIKKERKKMICLKIVSFPIWFQCTSMKATDKPKVPPANTSHQWCLKNKKKNRK